MVAFAIFSINQATKYNSKGHRTKKEISFSFLFSVLKAAWWKIVIIAMAAAIVCIAFTQFVVPKKYESTIQFYIINTNTTAEYTQTALLSANKYLANDYIAIIKGDKMVNKLIGELYKGGFGVFTYSQVRGMIDSSTSSTSSTFEITVRTWDKDVSYCVAETIKREAPEIIREITRPSYTSKYYVKVEDVDGYPVFEKLDETDLECVAVVRDPKLAATHVSTHVVAYTFIVTVLAACIAYSLFFALKFFDTTIRGEKTVRELVNPEITIVGVIPYWSHSDNTDTKDQPKE